MTNSIREVVNNEVIFVIGSNTTENHPVIGSMMMQAKKNGAKIIVADPRRIDLAKEAEIYLAIKPGTNVALVNGMMKAIIEEDLLDHEFIAERTENYEAVVESLKDCTVEMAARICDVPEEDIREAARIFAKTERGAIYYAMGITQHSHGTDNVIAIANLAMMTGNVGKEFTGVNPLRGQSNVQGACDVGGLPDVYPSYSKVTDGKAKEKFEKLWNVQGMSQELGLTIPKMIDGASDGSVKFMYIMGENPMVSDPDINHLEKAIEKLEFLVVQDIFMTETALKADVILPAAAFAEKDGTFTNTERRIQRIRKAIDPPGQAKADWEIFHELMKRMGYVNSFTNAKEIFDEIAQVTPLYAGASFDRIDKKGLQWPVKDSEHEGTPYLHNGTFTRGKGKFMPVNYLNPAELVDEEYPLILTTGRVLYHYHTRTMTGRVEGLNEIVAEAFIEISPITAEKFDVVDGKMVKVASRRGEIELIAKVTKDIKDGIVFIPFHFAEAAANRLTHASLDPIADIPELKVAAVKIKKMA